MPSKRRCLVQCTDEVAVLLRSGKALGFSVLDQQRVFNRDVVELILESESLPPVPEGSTYPLATLRENPDKTLTVVFEP